MSEWRTPTRVSVDGSQTQPLTRAVGVVQGVIREVWLTPDALQPQTPTPVRQEEEDGA